MDPAWLLSFRKQSTNNSRRCRTSHQLDRPPDSERTWAGQATLDEDLARFPYVNGRLFEEPLRIPAFNAEMRTALLDACRFDWSNISPAIILRR